MKSYYCNYCKGIGEYCEDCGVHCEDHVLVPHENGRTLCVECSAWEDARKSRGEGADLWIEVAMHRFIVGEGEGA